MKRLKRGEATEVYSRVVGFLTPVQNWNTEKKEEFKEKLDTDHLTSVSA